MAPAGLAEHVRRVAAERLTLGSPELWMALLPVACYWLIACAYDLLDYLQLPFTERYRIRSGAEKAKRNSRSKSHVICRVLSQHAIQVAVSIGLVFADPEMCDARRSRSWAASAARFAAGMLVMDSWQYFIHRGVHESKALYNGVHSHHHRLLVCYAYGALYNHPLEALLLDTLGGVVSMYAAGLSCGGAAALWTLGCAKTVFDHSGYVWPVNPAAPLFPNNALYHDVHHDPRGFRKNYSQPFFTFWDRAMGTYMDPAEIHAGRDFCPQAKDGGGGGKEGGGADAAPPSPPQRPRRAAVKKLA
ncbi:sphinganine C(4)-monooxygenase-like [Raphidocelis subcapitata]|uniref:Sphinganine C(4)-monooxygenase-like n=1 Tax=Raphidocelis subcapitata TaxID=307507 RepID=A0A2V0PIH1_9CHLO|nr:sphinganine C(4)-monooxygenase-like [Raphidocelis subcapitata]|eukprot:GBF97700.1 sphinganine C(4)-monooxygenase-like [Raphidocelis subcapitata]